MYTLTVQDNNAQQVCQVSFEQGSYVIGRLDECDIHLPSSSVSRKHARLFVHNGRCYIEDLGSANGILVDGQRVVGRRDLGTASQLRLGEYYLYLEFQRAQTASGEDQRVLQTLFIPQDEDLFKLVRICDNFAGEEFVLSEVENTIGRTDENFILLSDSSISRYHSKVYRHGDHYQVQDLGSSNGSTLNGKALTAPQTLKPQDRVKFGNVEFVFVEGTREVDTRAYQSAPSATSKTHIVITVAILLIVGIALGATSLFMLNRIKSGGGGDEPDERARSERPSVETSVDDRLAGLKQQAERAERENNWALLESTSREILALSPEDQSAQRTKELAAHEQEAASLLDQSGRYVERGEYEEALKILRKVPEDAQAHKNAQSSITHIRRTLAHNYKNEAAALEKKSSSWKKAHALLVKAAEISEAPDDELLERIEALEKKMRKRRVRFQAYEEGPL